MASLLDSHQVRRLRLRIETDNHLYSGMKKFKVKGKDLSKLPDELFSLLELEILDLSPERESCLHYRLSEVPSGIGRLVNLRVLMLDTNELETLPAEISLLTNLERLSLSNNNITCLPDGFVSLKKLLSLHIANCELDTFPRVLCELENLRFLDLSDNKIADIPSEISQMKSLETLLLFINQISFLPDSICTLINLRSLWIGQNTIRQLPRHFGNLINLDWGYRHTSSTVVDGNPLTHPPLDICKRGVSEIARYFARADRDQRSQ